MISERLYRLERFDFQSPLFTLASTDPAGHVPFTAACDPDDYR